MLDCSLLSPRKKYLLALSGGRDSVALLHLLLEAGFRDLHLVHLDHQLRGEESDADAAFVRDLAREHDLELTLAKKEIAALASQAKESLETTARKARHELFAKVARSTGCRRILLAHHAEDQAETVLFNLLRGSAGLRGMGSATEIAVSGERLQLLRPLLGTRREEIDQFLSERKLPYREDRSNADSDYTRNRMRHEALPLLSNILQRDIIPALLRATEAARQDQETLASLLHHLRLQDPQGRLYLPKLRDLPAALQRASLADYLRQHEVSGVSQALLDDACALIPADGPPALNLPGDRFLRRREARIFLEE